MLKNTFIKSTVFTVALFAAANSYAESPMLGNELSCVADGIRSATGGKVEPSERWIALLAASAQQFHGPRAIHRGGEQARNWLQTRVISMVQTYGFCSAFPRKPENSGYPHMFDKNEIFTARKFFLGSARSNFSTMPKDEQEKFLSIMGFKEPGFLTKNIQPLKDLFSIEGDWWTTPVQARKKDFMSSVSRALNSDTATTPGETQTTSLNLFDKSTMGAGLKECLSQVESLQKNNPIYNSSDKNHRKASSEFCTKVAASCGIDGASFCSVDGTGGSSNGTPNGNTGTAGDFFGTAK